MRAILIEFGPPIILATIASTIAFITMRNQFKNIISYVIGEKVFKKEYKQQSLKDRFWFNNYRAILPEWMIIWYVAELVAIITVYLLYVLCHFFPNVVYLTLGVIVFIYSPFVFKIYLIGNYKGLYCDYEKIVDKYAIRRKLYPELYEDDEEQSEAQAEDEQSDDDSVIDN